MTVTSDSKGNAFLKEGVYDDDDESVFCALHASDCSSSRCPERYVTVQSQNQ